MRPACSARVAFALIVAPLFGCARGADANAFDLDVAPADGGPADASVTITTGTGAGPFTIGGSVRGLVGTVTLENNGTDTLDVTAPPGGAPVTFTFATALERGRTYSVTTLTKPSGPTCNVTSGGTGTVGGADVKDVVVSCDGSQTFAFTGAPQIFAVPAGVSEVTLEVWGAQGQRNALGVLGGLGGYATGKLAVSGGQLLHVYVGGGDATATAGGYNGGGAAGASPCATARGGGGGGASDVRTGGGLGDRVIVAGGGGGAGGNRVSGCGRGTGGGGGAGWFGGGGGAGFPGASPGALPTGGTQAAGGTGGVSTLTGTNNGVGGASGIGGAGGPEVSSGQAGSATASTGGLGGGATGASGTYAGDFTGQSGGGGSGYIGGVTAGTMTAGNRAGAGQIIVRYGF